MLKKVFRYAFVFCGMLLGYGVISDLMAKHPEAFGALDNNGRFMLIATTILLFGIISTIIYELLDGQNDVNVKSYVVEAFAKIPPQELIPSMGGLLLGMLAASLVTNILGAIPYFSGNVVGVLLTILIYFILGFYGLYTGRRIGRIYVSKVSQIDFSEILKRKPKSRHNAAPKIFDTSVIIDGRIHDILGTGFIEGDIIIPDFVLVELRHIADSEDELKRVRGRRGLDILNSIQEEYGIEIYNTASDKELKKVPEVDVKLLKLTQKLNGMLVTNDYNLNKVAAVEEIEVLNINELANTLKPVSIPGEIMIVKPVKAGKNPDQSVAYLEDGTMILVQKGKNNIGKEIETYVTSVLQTAAGRMIFVKPKE